MKITLNKFLVIFVLIPFLFIAIVYASFSSGLIIDGTAYLRIPADIRITDLKVAEQTDGAYEVYSSEFNKDSTSIFVSLPSNSSITYEVFVSNKSENDYLLGNLIESTFSNTDVSYDISTFKYDLYSALNDKSFMITITNNTDKIQEATLILEYVFIIDEFESPVITGGSTEWLFSNQTISLLSAGNATTGVKHYEYYISNDLSVPTYESIATGVTDNQLVISTSGYHYVYYRSVSIGGTRSSWSVPQIVKIDMVNYEDSQTIIDLSGNGNDAKIVGATITDEGLVFDGVDDYAYIPLLDWNGTKAFTIEFTAKVLQSDDYFALILFESSVDSNDNHGSFYIDTSEYGTKDITLAMKFPGKPSVINHKMVNNILDENKFQTYALSFDSTNGHDLYINMFVNGIKQNVVLTVKDSTDYGGIVTDEVIENYPFYIASRAGDNLFTPMILQDLKIYTKELTELEVLSNLNGSVVTDNMLLHYDLNHKNIG